MGPIAVMLLLLLVLLLLLLLLLLNAHRTVHECALRSGLT